MIRFLSDEDFNGRIVRGLFLRKSDLDLVRVQDVGLLGADDDEVLEWADQNGRVLLTHDGRTMPNHVRNRLAAGSHLPGVFIVDDLASIGDCVEDILLVAECSEEGEWEDQIHYLPFK
ncbi:MAG: DUF5615 family PIN-like protein [Planctomycetes bacterium]|nr:DUF5615 family PIN-like protein [Planctomycetota bacterium]MBL7040336.1 DUF5615 family PIN-like protein [Pirellulaceae bacterium]